jgi:hypothetical protein
VSDPLLDAVDIKHLLHEVADELGEGPRRTIILVGGAALAISGLRQATRDVDSVARLDPALAAAVARVAERHELGANWLNDSAAPFLPITFDEAECSTIIDRPLLLVLGAPMNQIFLMKLYASRSVDVDDLEAMWPHCSFRSPEKAAASFHEAYPHLEFDPYLADHIRAIT